MKDLDHAEVSASLSAFAPMTGRGGEVGMMLGAGPVAALNGASLRLGTAEGATAAAPTRAAGARRPGYRERGKRALDILLSLLALPVAVPLLLVSMLLLAFEGKPLFYSQKRIGRNGRLFRMYKLRTMVPGADRLLEQTLARDPALRAEWDRTQKLKNDPRITRLGAFLRRSSLDELPQIWHVLTGDMSWVGPRPMMPDQLELYGNAASYMAVRPGITGLWQVMERNDSDFASRARADRNYDRNMSFALDLKLILMTFSVVVRGTGH